MKHITIIIPTRNRFPKLKRALDSILNVKNVDIIVVCDGDESTYKNLSAKSFEDIKRILIPKHKGSVYCRNYAMQNVKDGVLCFCDDTTFRSNAVDIALKEFNRYFPDDDGVLGLRQNHQHHPAGITLIGQKFLNRYPDRQVFNPQYNLFACQEIEWLATHYGKFQMSKDILVNHYHPCFYPNEKDKTHIEGRITKNKDMRLIQERKQKGLIWGL